MPENASQNNPTRQQWELLATPGEVQEAQVEVEVDENKGPANRSRLKELLKAIDEQ